MNNLQMAKGIKEVNDLTREIFENEKWLTELLSKHVNLKNALFVALVQGEVDACDYVEDLEDDLEEAFTSFGFFVTCNGVLYSFTHTEWFNPDKDDYEELEFEVRKVETPKEYERIEKEYPLVKIALEMQKTDNNF